MKKLITMIVLCTIMLAGFVMPVYAQDDTGYPVDYPEPLCSEAYWDGISPNDCIAYYETEYPDTATGCPEGLEGNDCVIYYEVLLFSSDEAEQYAGEVDVVRKVNENGSITYSPDVKAGGEGPGSFIYAVVLIVSIAVVGWWIVGKFIAKDEE